MSKIIIATSVGIDRDNLAIINSPSRWVTSREDLDVYTFYPWDLAYTSSLLKRDTEHKVKMIDGCLERLNHERYFKRLMEEKPDWLIMETSSRMIQDDLKLALSIKKELGTRLIFCGQHPTAFPKEVLAGDGKREVDYVCIGEYQYTVLELLQGKDHHEILGLYPNARRPLFDVQDLPFPEDDDVSRLHYSLNEPTCEYVEIQMYASRGCPASCNFCVCRHLYYAKPNWRPRKAENIIAEIKHLKDKYPQMEGVFFDEEYHNASKKFILNLTKGIIDNNLHHLHYSAMCGYSTLDYEVLSAMKEAGYYMLRMGIETGSLDVAKRIGMEKKFSPKKLKEVLRIAKEIGIKIYGTFTLGTFESNKDEDAKTVDLIYELVSQGLVNRLQISINTPQPGTPFYNEAKRKGYLITDDWKMYDGEQHAVVSYPSYTNKEIEEMHCRARQALDDGLKFKNEGVMGKLVRTTISKLGISNVSNILVIRSGRIWQVNFAIDSLKNIFPDSNIVLLAQERVKDKFPNANEIVVCQDGFFNIFSLGQEILGRLKSKRFDLGVILYTTSTGKGYRHVESIVSHISPRYTLAFNLEGDSFYLGDITRRRVC